MNNKTKSNAINQAIADIFTEDENKKQFFQQNVGNFIITFSNRYNITVDDSIKWTKELTKKMDSAFLIKN